MTNTLGQAEWAGYAIRPDWDDARRKKMVGDQPSGRPRRDFGTSTRSSP